MRLDISIWIFVGLILGMFHSIFLWRATHRPPQWSDAALRLFAIGALLTMGAAVGRILPIATGWFLGFPITTLFFYVRTRT